MQIRVKSRGKALLAADPRYVVPAQVAVTLTDLEPYEFQLETTYNAETGLYEDEKLTITRTEDGPQITMGELQKVRLRDLAVQAMESELIGAHGWPSIVADHDDVEQAKVDALVYRLAYAIGSRRPTECVAEARGIGQPAATRRVQRARDKGLLRAATPGRAGV
jgi:hypothetical protein